jgi:hypothetical protein
MRVKDLIKKLEDMPQDIEVLFDATPSDAEMFKFVSIDEVDEIEDPDGNKFILLFCGLETPEINEN